MLLDWDRMGRSRHLLTGLVVLVCLFLLLPIVFVAVLSFNSSRWLILPPPSWTTAWYERLLSEPSWLEAMLNSVKIGVLVAIVSLLLGIPAAFAIVRGRFRGRRVIEGFFTMPLIVPVIIIAVALYGVLLRLGLTGTLAGLVASHVVLALPFAVISVANALRGFDIALEQAAMVCGASRWQTLWRVTLPSIRSGIVAGALFAFLISWDEVILAIFMAGTTTQTLPVKMWTSLRSDISPLIAAASTIMVVSTAALIALVMLVAGRNVKWRKP